MTLLRVAPEVSSDSTPTPDQSFVCGCVDSPGNVCKAVKKKKKGDLEAGKKVQEKERERGCCCSLTTPIVNT